MKCQILILFLVVITTINSQEQKWQTQQIDYNGKPLKIVFFKGIDPQNILSIIGQVDKSTVSTNPNSAGASDAFIRPNDVILCSKKLLIWFSLASKQERKVRSGGGLVSGVWELLENEKTKELKLKRVKNENGYTPNLLLPGSSPNVQLFGADVFGGYVGSRVVWGLEHSMGTEPTNRFGKDIMGLDRGPYSPDNGVFIEFQGLVGNSAMGAGFDTPTDTDPRPGIVGKTVYKLTYRVPANRFEYIQEVEFKVLENNFGPLSTAYMALYLPGYGRSNMVYATHPQMMPAGGMDLKNVQENKYFKNSCVKKVWFYEMPFVAQNGKKSSAHTPEGRGRIACIGSPKANLEENIPFICGYPTNEYIPKKTYPEYTLEIGDNQTMSRFGRFQSINYKITNNVKQNVLLSTKGKRKLFTIIMRYKIIDAIGAVKKKKK